MLQIQNRALLDRTATNTFSVKMFCLQKINLLLNFLETSTCLNVGLLVIGHVFLSPYCVLVGYDKLQFHERYYIHLNILIFYLGSNDTRKRTSGKDTTLYSGGFRFKSQAELLL